MNPKPERCASALAGSICLSRQAMRHTAFVRWHCGTSHLDPELEKDRDAYKRLRRNGEQPV
jgi:hypothetical protein